jgi:hypothetical protein
MAHIAIGPGFPGSAEEEALLCTVAADLPPAWRVSIDVDCGSGIFEMRLEGPNLSDVRVFGPREVESALMYLAAFADVPTRASASAGLPLDAFLRP